MSYRFADSLLAKLSPDDGQKNCPKHAEFYSRNKLQKLAYLVDFIIRIDHDARTPERQTSFLFVSLLPKCHPHYPLFPNSTKIWGTHIYQIPHYHYAVLFRYARINKAN